MKTEEAEYIEKDEKETRLPVELYHIWTESGIHWRYTSGDSTITFEGETFLPATIKRGKIEFNEEIESTKVTFEINYIAQPQIQYLATNPVDITWVQVLKLFRDSSPYSASTLFIGTIKNVSFQGLSASTECTGFEHFLKRIIPRFRYQPSCSYFLYDDFCTINKTNFQLDTDVTTIDDTGLVITNSDFALQDDDFYSLGYLEFNNTKRMIIYHIGDTIKIRYPITELVATDSITVFAGCNKTPEICRDKFDNILNFGGMPYVPIDNPVTWG